MTGRNDIQLVSPLTGEPGHFHLREFANADGIVAVHRCLLKSLELVRADLARAHGSEVYVVVTSGTRTQKDLERLAALYGWTDDGGKVSRTSKHLIKYGGIAADIKAIVAGSYWHVPQDQLGAICRRHFDWVKDDYDDGHVHADNRNYRRE